VIPQTIVGYNFNTNWIVAKTDSNYYNGQDDYAYWIFRKHAFKTTNLDSIIKANLIGPLDSIKFYELLSEKNINLPLINYPTK